jgi:hypothetical protein
MDGPRPLQELTQAESMGRVLKFRKLNTDEVAFAVDEILDPTGMCLATVVRPATNQDVSRNPFIEVDGTSTNPLSDQHNTGK